MLQRIAVVKGENDSVVMGIVCGFGLVTIFWPTWSEFITFVEGLQVFIEQANIENHKRHKLIDFIETIKELDNIK